MSKEFSKGDTVYGLKGQEGVYVVNVSNGHIVEPCYEDEDSDEPCYGRPETWGQVFAKPPREKLHAEIAELESQRQAAHQALLDVEAKRRIFDQEERARMQRIRNYEGLAILDAFVSGSITHILNIEGYGGYKIIPIAEATGYEKFVCIQADRYNSGREKLRWTFQVSNDSINGVPCTSEEHARELLGKECLKRFEEWRKDRRDHYIERWVEIAEQLGINAPSDVASYIADKALKEKAANLAKAQQDLAKTQAQFDTAKAAYSALGATK